MMGRRRLFVLTACARALLFNSAAVTFFRQPLLLGFRWRTCGATALGNVQGLLHQVLKALDDLGTIAVLAAGRLGREVENAVAIDVGFESAEHACPLLLVQARGVRDIEGQRDLRLRTIDMLPARAATTAELEVEFRQGDGYRVGNR